MSKFSVVIAVYNKGEYLNRTLQSVLCQTHEDFEVIIVNDGSTDNSEAIIRSFKDPRISYYYQENQGAAAARNAAINKANNNYIALLDADDYWYPHYLEEHLRMIKLYPDHDVFSTASEIARDNKIIPKQYSIETENKSEVIVDYFKASMLHSILHSSTSVIKKSVFDDIGLYDPSIKSGQDTDLYIRIGLKYKVVFSPKISVRYYVLENSLFRSSRSLRDKANFTAYETIEDKNENLKKFLDLNRYQLCLFAKLNQDKSGFNKYFHKIDLNNLTRRQLFLLKQNGNVLRMLYKIKTKLERLGLSLTTY